MAPPTVTLAVFIMALFAMTPYFYKTGRAAAERIGHTDSLECTAAVGVAVYSKE